LPHAEAFAKHVKVINEGILEGGDRNIWAAIVGDRIVASVSMNQAPGPDDQFEKFSKAVTEELKFYGSIQPGEICDGKWHPRSFLTKRL
jgi:hypothetical protein